MTQIFNPGSMMRRNADQIDHKPCVGLLKRNGEITRHPIDIGRDSISDAVTGSPSGDEMSVAPFLRELQNLKLKSLSFADAIQQVIDAGDVSQEARQILLEAIDDDGPDSGERQRAIR